MTEIPTSGLQLRSLVDADGTLHLSLQEVDLPAPSEHEVLVRVDAAPLNPSDLGLLLAGADLPAATFAGSGASSTVTAPIPPETMRALAGPHRRQPSPSATRAPARSSPRGRPTPPRRCSARRWGSSVGRCTRSTAASL